MATKTDEIRSRLVEANARLIEEVAKYEDTPPSADQLAELNRMKAEVSDIRSEMESASQFDSLRSDALDMKSWLAQPANRPPHAGAPLGEPRIDRRSLGERFVSDDQFKQWRAAIGLNPGFVSDRRHIGDSPALQVGSLLSPQSALITGQSSTSGGALFMNDEYGPVTALGRRELTVRDIITNGTTDSDTVEYVRVTTETNAAAPVAEATATGDGSGAKPESTLAFERVTTPVKVIAHWIPATKMALADAGQLRTLIDGFLRYGLEEELEDQIVNGDGVGQNFTGIFSTTGTQTQAWSTDILETTRKAKTLVSTVGRRRPNAYLLSPTSWETIDLLQDNEAKYYAGGPFSVMTPRLWGLPVVISEALPTGYALVGDFSMAVLWDRQAATIQVSDSHSDFFIRNLVAILAEMRAAFGVLKPNAFVEIDVVA